MENDYVIITKFPSHLPEGYRQRRRENIRHDMIRKVAELVADGKWHNMRLMVEEYEEHQKTPAAAYLAVSNYVMVGRIEIGTVTMRDYSVSVIDTTPRYSTPKLIQEVASQQLKKRFDHPMELVKRFWRYVNGEAESW